MAVIKRFLAVSIFAFTLTACGGGGSSGSQTRTILPMLQQVMQKPEKKPEQKPKQPVIPQQPQKNTIPQFNLRTALTLSETSRLRLALPLHYDHGYRAALYQAKPFFGFGFIAQWAASKNLVLGLHLHDALQFSGEIDEQPCHDGFRRAFQCGSGLPWTDAAPLLKNQEIAASGKINLNWRF